MALRRNDMLDAALRKRSGVGAPTKLDVLSAADEVVTRCQEVNDRQKEIITRLAAKHEDVVKLARDLQRDGDMTPRARQAIEELLRN